MQPYEFLRLPRTSSVAAVVTTLVSGWFVLAGGAILTDRHSEYTVESARATPARLVEIPPQARFSIVVEARRADADRPDAARI